MFQGLNPLSVNPTKWSDTLKQFVGNLRTNCLSVFDHFVGLALKRLKTSLEFRINSLLLLKTLSIILFAQFCQHQICINR